MPTLGRFFVIKSQMNGMVLDVKHAKMEEGTSVITYCYHGKDNQLWYEDSEDRVIRSKADENYVLDVDDEKKKLIITRFTEKNSRLFWLYLDNYLRQRDSALVAGIRDGKDKKGAKIVLEKQADEERQKWEFEYQPRKFFEIRSKMHDKCLTVMSDDEGQSEVNIQEAKGEDNQLWYEDRYGNICTKKDDLPLKVTGDGVMTLALSLADDSVSLVRKGSYLEKRYVDETCLDISEENRDDGADVIMYQKHGGDNQLWYYHYVKDKEEEENE